METNRKTILVQLQFIFFILLFIYAAISKLMDFSKFQIQLDKCFHLIIMLLLFPIHYNYNWNS